MCQQEQSGMAIALLGMFDTEKRGLPQCVDYLQP